jgi:inner membrane protein YidH
VSGDRRWPRSVYRVGSDPDPRFSLANERTVLAWLRTALALVVAGVSLALFLDSLDPGPRRALAVALILVGAGASVGAFLRWMRIERSLRRRESLPGLGLAAVPAYALAAVGVALCVLVWLGEIA